MAEIRVLDLHKAFAEFTAVKGSTFTVEDGEFFCLLGPSGCGKTTTLRMIAGLELPTSGQIFLGEEDVSFKRASARDIAFVFQMFALYPHMNVRRNIAFPLVSQGMLKSEIERQVGILDSQGNVATDYIEGPLFTALKAKIDAVVAAGSVPQLNSCERAPLAVQGAPPASGLFPFDKYSSAFLLVEAARDAARAADHDRRLFVVPNTHVIRLRTAGGAVSGIEASFNGAAKFLGISPKTAVVLAMGTIESTRMALASFPTSPNPQKELMGRNLMVHVRDNIKVRIRRSAIAVPGTLPSTLQAAAMLVRGSTAQGKFHLQVTASADTGSDPDPDRLLFSMIPDVDQVDSLLAMQSNDMISIWLRGVSESKGDTTTPVPAQGVSFINLSPFESDEFGVPRAFVHINQSRDTGLADAMDAAARKLVSALDSNAQFVSFDRDAAGSTYHEAGTLWVGDSPATSVTDTNGRFHHVSNAYCSDQSLFPTSGSVNPTLTGLTLTRRVAQAIIARPR